MENTQLILKLLKSVTCMCSLIICTVFVKISSSIALGQTIYVYFVLSSWKWSLLLKRRKELRRTLTLKQCLVKNISLFHHFNMKKESQQLVNLKIPVLRCICFKRMFCMKYNTNILFILQYKNKPGSKSITVLTSILELFCYRHLSKLYSKKRML